MGLNGKEWASGSWRIEDEGNGVSVLGGDVQVM